jgi:hypothetical protein
LLAGIRSRDFDVVVVEDLTRLSRNDADTARFKEIIEFNKIEILTQTGWKKGSDFAVHGLINSFDKGTRAVGVRRGQSLCLSLGQVPGAPAYGYRVVPNKPGEHEIDVEAAKIVVRIFTEYAAGRSPNSRHTGAQFVSGVQNNQGSHCGTRAFMFRYYQHREIGVLVVDADLHVMAAVANRAVEQRLEHLLHHYRASLDASGRT